MAARLAHASGTPTTLDLQLCEQTEIPEVLKTEHRTASGQRLRYIRGDRVRQSQCVFALKTATEYDNFYSFFETVEEVNTRFTFTPDFTNFPSRTYTAFFLGQPSFERVRVPGARIMGFVTVTIEDQPVAL